MDKIKRALRVARPKYQDGGSLPFVSFPADDLAKAQADPYRYERFFEPVATAVKSLGDLVKAPFDMARDARQAGGYSQLDPTDVGRAGLNTGLGTLMPAVGGVGGRGGAVLMSGAGPTDKKGITAYHGSPHDFDRFDMSKIGTGEGNQAYGHGLYFAQSEDVAKTYKAAGNPGYQDIGVVRRIQEALREANGDEKAARELLNNKAMSATGRERQQLFDAYNNFYEARESGRMYEVRIDADPEDFLDWDKPLSQQSEKVRSALQNKIAQSAAEADAAGHGWAKSAWEALQGPSDLDGDVFLRAVGDRLTRDPKTGEGIGGHFNDKGHPSPQLASKFLSDAGIHGVRYLDQGSRPAGQGSRNYVLFSDDIINIVRKYGMAAAVSMYGADAVNNALQPMATGNDG